MNSVDLVVILFTIDIAVHTAVSIAVGVYLNRIAKREVSQAAETVGASISVELPKLAGPLVEHLLSSVQKEKSS
jgi:hypothetical protein